MHVGSMVITYRLHTGTPAAMNRSRWICKSCPAVASMLRCRHVPHKSLGSLRLARKHLEEGVRSQQSWRDGVRDVDTGIFLHHTLHPIMNRVDISSVTDSARHII